MVLHSFIGRLRPDQPLDAMILTSLIWFLAKFIRYAFPPLFEPIGVAYDVSNAVLGASYTGFMLTYAAMQFPSGVFADRFGSVPVVTGGVVLASVAAVAVVVRSPFAILVVAMLVMGAGTGAHKTVAVRLLSQVYPSNTGRAIGVLDTVGTFGGVAAPIAVVLFIDIQWGLGAGWRLVFGTAGLVGLVLAAAFVHRVPKRVPEEPRDEQSEDGTVDPRRYVSLFRRASFSTFVVVVVLFAFAYSGVVAFLPLYLIDEVGLAPATANLLFGVLFFASLSQILTGEVSDRVGQLPVICASFGLASASTTALVLLGGVADVFVVGAIVVAIGIGVHGAIPVRSSYLMAILPVDIAGGSLGVVRTLLMGAAAISPAIVGYLSDTVGFRIAFWLLTGAMVTATLLSVLLLVSEGS